MDNNDRKLGQTVNIVVRQKPPFMKSRELYVCMFYHTMTFAVVHFLDSLAWPFFIFFFNLCSSVFNILAYILHFNRFAFYSIYFSR